MGLRCGAAIEHISCMYEAMTLILGTYNTKTIYA